VISEFIADLYPLSGIFPTDPAERAKIRLFVDSATKKLIPALSGVATGVPHEEALEHIDAIQRFLDPKRKFFLGDKITLADAVVAPFLSYLHTMSGPRIKLKEDGEIAKLVSALKEKKNSTFMKYVGAVVAHPSVKETFDEVRFSRVF
jgi:glutathione S-transferase